jgi:hypothetical protein
LLSEAVGKENEIKGLPREETGKVKSIGEVKEAQQQLGNANKITDKAQGYGSDVKNLSQGNLSPLLVFQSQGYSCYETELKKGD